MPRSDKQLEGGFKNYMIFEQEKENQETHSVKCEKCGIVFAELTEEEEFKIVDELGVCSSCNGEYKVLI